MSNTAKPLAKSLHTVTVLVQVSRHLMDCYHHDADFAVGRAVDILGLKGKPDIYGLVDLARNQLGPRVAVQPLPSHDVETFEALCIPAR
jgi:hypothetical protein